MGHSISVTNIALFNVAFQCNAKSHSEATYCTTFFDMVMDAVVMDAVVWTWSWMLLYGHGHGCCCMDMVMDAVV
jgi:hypothetical protein